MTTLIANIAKGGYLDKASDIWLTLLARYVYGVERIAATYPTGQVTLINTGGGVYAFNPGDLTLKNTISGVTYTNDALINLAALGTVTSAFTAKTAGASSTSYIGEINGIESPSLPAVTVSNSAALVGFDEEDDGTLRIRCKERLGALSPNGPPDAYAYIAKLAVRSDGVPAGVNRVSLLNDGVGNVTVYVAKPNASVTGTIGNLATDLGAVSDAIQRQAVPQGITANVLSATKTFISMSYDVFLYDTVSATDAEITTAIEAAVTALLAATPIGGDIRPGFPGQVYMDHIKAAMYAATVRGQKLPIFNLVTSFDGIVTPYPINADEFPGVGVLIASSVTRVKVPGVT
jgi:uncharacterized phage protein gp47/JayE